MGSNQRLSTENKPKRQAIIVRKAHLDSVFDDLNEIIGLIVSGSIPDAEIAPDLRRIARKVANLQTVQTGTARL